jgi:hypothetical protein
MTEVIYLHDRRTRAASPEILPPQDVENAEARRAALYDMLRLLGRAVRTNDMAIEDKEEFALAALKVLGPDWELSRSC